MTNRGAENARRHCGCEPHRPGARNVDCRTDPNLGGYSAVKTGRQNVGQASQIADLCHGLLLVREFEQVEISIGHHDVVGLAADPAAHIDVTVGPAGAVAIDMETDAGIALTTGSATAASDIERNRDEIADLEVLDIAALLDHLAGDLVAQHHTGRRVVRPRTIC
jgi:hypothetical protein